MEKINHRAIQLSGSSHLMLKSLFCPIDLRIATRCRESEFPPTELMRLEADTRTCAAMAHVQQWHMCSNGTCAAMAHVRSFNSELVRLKVRLRNRRGRFNSKLVRLKDLPPLSLIKKVRCFNSKLVRLKGFPKTTLILYCTLTVPVS